MLMEELRKTKEQCSRFKDQITEVKTSAEKAVLDENRNWSIITQALKENQEKELLRKQKEIGSLHDLLAEWIIKYLALEKKRAVCGKQNKISSRINQSNQNTQRPNN
eukprot:TRINITY_DN23058_c0_g1_i1.p2 TRINITY_DN23058_c0_g1~~TRINITY_DN23058_c0_g1_i1.p2  ORF type:complete len:107 (+),score=19.81 TRINITY_DN23058_c0_g1_i1:169-489(+)